MRPIKFRAWDISDKKWLNPDCLYEPNKLPVVPFNDGFIIESDKVIYCQFTGLLDKNGKEIYEGDIVKNNGKIWEIYWAEENACYHMANNGVHTSNDFLFINESRHSEVIGNIYENPELLK